MRKQYLNVESRTIITSLVLLISLLFYSVSYGYGDNMTVDEDRLYVGAASVDITPPLPVALQGQMYDRVAKEIESPVTSNIIIIRGEKEKPIAFVSCDLVGIPEALMDSIMDKIVVSIPEISKDRIIVNAIHDHTAPSISLGYDVLGASTSEDNIIFISDRIAEGAKEAWDKLAPGNVTWGFGHASVATNRRATYVDGTHQMYGGTHLTEFRGLEWASPDKLNILFFWNDKDELIATSINVPCPAQVVESRYAVNGDFMHVVRENLKKEFGKDLVVLGWIDAAGDQSPHSMVDGPAERRMRELAGIDRLQQLGDRISREVINVYDVVKNDKHQDVKIEHRSRNIQLTKRPITQQNMKDAQAAIDNIDSDKMFGEKGDPFKRWKQRVVDRYDAQLKNPDEKFETTIHIVRLGDVAICTNQFELFHAFGEQIVARSKALQTFNIQLTGRGTYLPSESALLGGGYSAIVESNMVGPKGGQELVEHTVEIVNSLFNEDLHTNQR